MVRGEPREREVRKKARCILGTLEDVREQNFLK